MDSGQAVSTTRRRRSINSRSPALSFCQCTTLITYVLGIVGILAIASFLVWQHLIVVKNNTNAERPIVDYADNRPKQEPPSLPQQRQPPRWKCGLRNLGNTCYMNSALQCLRHIPVLNGFLSHPAISRQIERRRNQSSDARWIWEYNELIDWMNYGEERGRCRRIDPRAVYDAMLHVAPRTFHRYRQEDATEVVQYFFQAVETVLANDPGATAAWNSIAKRTEVIDRRRWTHDGALMPLVNVAPESSYDLRLILPEQNDVIDLRALMDRYFNEPMQDLGDAGSMQETRRIRVAPDVLVVALNRVNLAQHQIQTPVQVPLRLDMQPFMEDETAVQYDLLAVVNHLGHGAKSGHYVAKARYGPNSEQWFLFNDQLVSIVSPENVIDTRHVCQVTYQRRRP